MINPTAETDAGLVYRLFNTPKWIRYIGDRNIRNEKDARDYITRKMRPQLEALGYSAFTLTRKTDKEKIGICGLFDRDGIDGIDLGFAILPAFERQGYAFEAARKVLDAAFKDFRLEKVFAITVRENTASRRLLEKLGLELSGVTRLPREDEELLLYKIERME